MNNQDEPQRLTGDATREATASIRGYVYQFYQSIDTWIALRDDEWLFLEAAEDLDKHTSEGVITTQIKDKPDRSVTLRSRDVIDSIEHFLQHASRNPSARVRFRFLTTASRGIETGHALPIAGLDYWDTASRDVSLVETLVVFLETLDLGPQTQNFIRTNTPQFIRDNLLSRVSWDTDAKPIDGVDSSIKKALVEIGHVYGVAPSEAEKVLPVALERVATLLRKGKAGPLSRVDFLRLFESATMEQMPKGEAAKLRAVMSRAVPLEEPALREPLPVLSGALERPKVVSALLARLAETQVVFVYGSTGLGKTALAALVDRRRPSARWATMRSLDSRATARTLRSVAAAIPSEPSPPSLVLDDLDLANDLPRDELTRLVFALRQAGGTLLVTTYSPAPRSLLDRLWLSERSNFRAEYFTVEEIEELLERANAPSSSRNNLARLVQTSTLGHPQLVQARIRSLSNSNFATPPQDVLRPLGDEEMRKEIRRRLVNEITSQESRTILYRLSVAMGPVGKRHARAVGEVPPTTRLALESLDSLVGPWLEEVGDGAFRVSPLVAGVGNELLDRTELRNTHAALARIPFLDRKATPEEFAAAFFHALASESDQCLVPFAHQLQTRGGVRRQRALAVALQPILVMATEANARAWPGNTFLDATVRIIQFQTAAALGEFELATDFAERAMHAAGRVAGVEQELVRGITAIQILLEVKVPLPATLTVPLLVEVRKLAERSPMFAEQINAYQASRREETRQQSVAQNLFSVEAVRIAGVDALSQLVGELGRLEPSERTHLLDALDSSSAALLVNNSWLHDVQKARLNVSAALACYENLHAVARTWERPALARAARIASAVVLGEYASDQDAALNQVTLALREFGERDGGLLIARAKIQLAIKDYRRAIEDFDASEQDTTVDEVDRAFARRNCAICHANLGQWESAAENLGSAEAAAETTLGLRQMSIGLRADRGMALWMAHHKREALVCLANALERLAGLPVDADLKSRHVHATVRHLILYLWQPHERTSVVEPPPGMCSNQEPHPAMAEHTIVELDGAWDLLVEIDERLGGPAKIRDMRGQTPQPRMRAMEVSARFAALAGIARGTTRTLDDAPRVLIEVFEIVEVRDEWSAALALSREPIPKLRSTAWTNDRAQALAALVVALGIVSVARSIPIPFSSWRQQFADLGAFPPLLELTLGAMEHESESLNPSDATLRAARAIGWLRNRNLSPVELFACHFWLLNALQVADAAGVAGDSMGELVLVWRTIALTRRAELVAPNLNCASIVEACDDTERGGRNKAAAVLLAVAPAVGVRLDSESQKVLEQLKTGADVRFN